MGMAAHVCAKLKRYLDGRVEELIPQLFLNYFLNLNILYNSIIINKIKNKT